MSTSRSLRLFTKPLLVALDFFDDRVPDDFDLRIREQPLLQNLRRAQLVAPMNQIHLVRVAREEIRLFRRRVAAADDGDRLVAEERAVADRAVRHALPRVLELAGNAELHRRAAGGDDDGRRLDRRRPTRCASRTCRPSRLLHALDDDAVLELGAELRGVIGEFLRELVPEDRLEAGIVLDQLGVQQLAARKAALEHDGFEHRAAGIHAGAHPRRARADDDDVVLIGRGQFRSSCSASSRSPSQCRQI